MVQIPERVLLDPVRFLEWIVGESSKKHLKEAVHNAIERRARDAGMKMSQYMALLGCNTPKRELTDIFKPTPPNYRLLADLLVRLDIPVHDLLRFRPRLRPWTNLADGDTIKIALGEHVGLRMKRPSVFPDNYVSAYDARALLHLVYFFEKTLGMWCHCEAIHYDVQEYPLEDRPPSESRRRTTKGLQAEIGARTDLYSMVKKARRTGGARVGAVVALGSSYINPLTSELTQRIVGPDSRDLPVKMYLPVACKAQHDDPLHKPGRDRRIEFHGEDHRSEKVGPKLWRDTAILLVDERKSGLATKREPVQAVCAGLGGLGTVGAVLALAKCGDYVMRGLKAAKQEGSLTGNGRFAAVVTIESKVPLPTVENLRATSTWLKPLKVDCF